MVDAPDNAGTRRPSDRVGNMVCGRRADVDILWSGIALRREVAIVGVEREGVLKTGIAAIRDCC